MSTPSRLVALATWLCACHEVVVPGGVIEYDSAGVRIIDNQRVTVPSAWRLESVPAIDIGVAVDGDSSFSHIRSVRRLDDGRIVVLDGDSREIRWFDPDGRYLESAGRAGRGQGRFDDLWLVGVSRDGELVIWDWSQASLTRVDDSATVTAVQQMPKADADILPWALFDDGSLLATRPHAGAPPIEGAVHRDTITLWRFDPGSDERSVVLRKPGVQWLHANGRDQWIPFTANPVFAVHDDVVTTTVGVLRVLEQWRSDGTLVRRIIEGGQPTLLTASDIDGYRERELHRLEDSERATELLHELSALDYPDLRPAWDRLVVGRDGYLWAREYVIDPGRPASWTVFDGNGYLAAGVRTPAGFEILDIADGMAFGVARDDDGVEHVRAYRVLRH